MGKRKDCDVMINMCLFTASNDIVMAFQTEVKRTEHRPVYSKEQAINRIITEWSAMRKLKQEP